MSTVNETKEKDEVKPNVQACALCGNTKSAKRECYYYAPQNKFDTTTFVPRLTYDERYILQSGYNSICENRTACRRFYSKQLGSGQPSASKGHSG